MSRYSSLRLGAFSLSNRLTAKSQGVFTFTVFVVLASLDNAAAGVLPPLYAIIARNFAANEAAFGLVTAVYVLVLAAAAILWGYWGDRSNRKRLLLIGTLVWGVALFLTGTAQTFSQFLLFQLLTAVGVGCVSSVGFSVVSDIIPPHRRGLALSLWSMSQALGAGTGALLASSLGAYDWRWPFWFIAAVGFLFAFLFLFTKEPQRGGAEPELAPVFAAGATYQHRISLTDIPHILARRSNAWLLLQSFFFTLAYGSTYWVPRWAIARVQAEGYSLETATIVGNLFVTLFGAGVFFSVFAGHLGDRWQQRNPRGRTRLAAIGLLGSVPFFVLLFFLPLKGVVIPQEGNLLTISWAVLVSLFTNGWVATAFLVALIGMALYSADPPNWAALVADVNLPEHRGTVIGLNKFTRAIGNAISVGSTGLIFAALTTEFAPPQNYAVGLALFQIVVIPAGLCYYGASRSVPGDIQAVKQTLTQRAKATIK